MMRFPGAMIPTSWTLPLRMQFFNLSIWGLRLGLLRGTCTHASRSACKDSPKYHMGLTTLDKSMHQSCEKPLMASPGCGGMPEIKSRMRSSSKA
eukprot:9635211-Karenia_brevis.AAC.1